MHHADIDVDVTTGSRFHPGEILLSMLVKFASIGALGASPLAVLSFEVLLNTGSMFDHANVRIPLVADRVLRLFVVTPRRTINWRCESVSSRTTVVASGAPDENGA